jgi:hypothetical protein
VILDKDKRFDGRFVFLKWSFVVGLDRMGCLVSLTFEFWMVCNSSCDVGYSWWLKGWYDDLVMYGLIWSGFILVKASYGCWCSIGGMMDFYKIRNGQSPCGDYLCWNGCIGCCRRVVDSEIGSWIMGADSVSCCIDWFGFLEKAWGRISV